MIGEIEVQTVAGQQLTIRKVVAFLKSRIHRSTTFVAPRNERELWQMVDQLAREARRPVPDVRLFRERAEALVGLLSATT